MNSKSYIYSTCHCHSNFSDGKNSIMEMALTAEQQGFAAIGISDHLVLHPQLSCQEIFWAMLPQRLNDYVNECLKVRKEVSIPLFIGLEVDFFPNNPRQPELDRLLASYDFDYLIGSIHFLDKFPIDNLKSDWAVLSQNEIDNYHQQYWETILQLVESEQFDIIGHIDIIKKMAFPASRCFDKLIQKVIMAIAQRNLIMEINTAGCNKPCAEIYPSPEILNAAAALGIRIILNDDAHCCQQVGQHYAETLTTLKDNTRLVNLLDIIR